MAERPPSTDEHRGPARPAHVRGKPTFVCAFPKPAAFHAPDSGTVLGRVWLEGHGIVDTEISSAHVRIDRAGGGMRVADVGSRNGTCVNGARVTPRDPVALADGAVVRIGRTLLVYREALVGELAPAPPKLGLVGPYGLRALAAALDGLARAPTSNVLVEGDTGSGKELVARAVATSLRKGKPFAAVNVAGVARGVFESQFFGHVAGAFSDARSASPGIVVAHDGGTIFLDEIGDLEMEQQAKLLRLLENREVLPVGGARAVNVDVLVLAATHRDLAAMVEAGTFRRDLYARLSMARVTVPALRDRREDVFAVAQALAERAGAKLDASAAEVEAVERLLLAPWPGNVRELDATLAAARRADAEPGLHSWALDAVLGEAPPPRDVLTDEIVSAAIEAAGGNVSIAADKLGVSRGKLLRFQKRSSK